MSAISSVKEGNSPTGCLSLPSIPPSFGSWLGNRIISFEKIAVSVVTVLASGLSLLVPCGQWTGRARRCIFSLGATLQAIRQFMYTGDNECTTSFGERFRVNLLIGNIPAGGSEGFNELREGMRSNMMIARVWKGIFCLQRGQGFDEPMENEYADNGATSEVNEQNPKEPHGQRNSLTDT